MKETIEAKDAPSPIGPYSQAIRAGGFVFVSGQIPLDPRTGQVVAGDIVTQTRQALNNLMAVLREAGSGPEKVVKTTVFLANLGDFGEFNRIYGEFLGDSKPARATVQVARLPKEVLIQIDAIAMA